MLALVRDLKGTRVVYYWIHKTRLERISPIFPNLPIAEEWLLKARHKSYKGNNRRSSFIDRRKLSGITESSDKRTASHSQPGRRATDKSPRVVLDLAKVKLDELKLLYTEDLIEESDIDLDIVFELPSETTDDSEEP